MRGIVPLRCRVAIRTESMAGTYFEVATSSNSNCKQQWLLSRWQHQTQQSRCIEESVRKCRIFARETPLRLFVPVLVLTRPVINPEPQLASISLYPLICLRHAFNRDLLLVLCAYGYVNGWTLDARQCLCVGIPSCPSTHGILATYYLPCKRRLVHERHLLGSTRSRCLLHTPDLSTKLY